MMTVAPGGRVAGLNEKWIGVPELAPRKGNGQEPSILLFAGAKIISVKTELASLNSALVVAIGNN